MARMKLVCRCGDCAHWEIVGDHGTESVFWRIMDKITPHFSEHFGAIRCKTCGVEYRATVSVDRHEDLTEIEDDPATVYATQEEIQASSARMMEAHRESLARLDDDDGAVGLPVTSLVGDMATIVDTARDVAIEIPDVAPQTFDDYGATSFNGGATGGGGGGANF